VVAATQVCCALVAVGATIWLAARVRTFDIVLLLGLALSVIVLAGPALWPWYLLWGLVLLAVTSAQKSGALVVAAGAGMLVVGPSGSPVLQGDAYIVVVLACAAAGWWLLERWRWPRSVTGGVAG
jgi:alpha-1,6-mannosyltransferase